VLGSKRVRAGRCRIGTVPAATRGVTKSECAEARSVRRLAAKLARSESLLKSAQASMVAGDERGWKAFVRRYRAEMKQPVKFALCSTRGWPALSHTADFAGRVLLRGGGAVPSVVLRELLEERRRQPGLGVRSDVTPETCMRDELQKLPAIGPTYGSDVRRLGVRSVKDLARRDPERLYARLCEMTGERQDPCVLYTFRCAVYAARTPRPKAELLECGPGKAGRWTTPVSGVTIA